MSEIRNTIIGCIKDVTGYEYKEENEHLVAADVSMDSLDQIEIVMDIEREFNIMIDDNEVLAIGETLTIKEFVDHYEKLVTLKIAV